MLLQNSIVNQECVITGSQRNTIQPFIASSKIYADFNKKIAVPKAKRLN